MEIPVIALSQLSRGVETRGGDKRPMLSDLRESGAIEQDADMVVFLFRPEYYKITVYEDGMPTHGVMEILIAKNRNGSLDIVKVRFIGKYTKVKDFDSLDIVRSQPNLKPLPPSYKDFQTGRHENTFEDKTEAPF